MRRTLNSGIRLDGPLAQEYELINAAHADNMSYAQFLEQPMEYQRLLLAHYSVGQRIEAVKAYKDYKSMKKRGR